MTHPQIHGGPISLSGAQRWQVPAAGCLRVVAGAVWLTRDGDLDDHWLMPGQCLALPRGARVTAEPARAGQRARLVWQAQPPSGAALPALLRVIVGERLLARLGGWRLQVAQWWSLNRQPSQPSHDPAVQAQSRTLP